MEKAVNLRSEIRTRGLGRGIEFKRRQVVLVVMDSPKYGNEGMSIRDQNNVLHVIHIPPENGNPLDLLTHGEYEKIKKGSLIALRIEEVITGITVQEPGGSGGEKEVELGEADCLCKCSQCGQAFVLTDLSGDDEAWKVDKIMKKHADISLQANGFACPAIPEIFWGPNFIEQRNLQDFLRKAKETAKGGK